MMEKSLISHEEKPEMLVKSLITTGLDGCFKVKSKVLAEKARKRPKLYLVTTQHQPLRDRLLLAKLFPSLYLSFRRSYRKWEMMFLKLSMPLFVQMKMTGRSSAISRRRHATVLFLLAPHTAATILCSL